MARELSLGEGGDALVALITCPDANSASVLADKLVGGQAAACVNIVPGLTSVYRWKGEICRDSEQLLVVKTNESNRHRVAQVLTELHPYDEPELLFLPVSSGSETYLDWLQNQVHSGG